MARPIGKLTAVAVRNAARRGYYNDGGGLYLQVSSSGAKSWVFRYRVAGKLHEMGLGPLHTVGLAEARTRARQCREHRLDGLDPLTIRKAARLQARLDAAKTMTFRQCAEAYIGAHKAGWKNPKHASQWPNTLSTYVYPIFGDVPVHVVDVGLVTQVLEQNASDQDAPAVSLWARKPETASRIRGRIESILDWAKVRGYRDGENPARWRGHLDQVLPKKSKMAKAARAAKGRGDHHPAMPFSEIPEFMVRLRGPHGVAARALEFTILTAKRTDEVIGSRRREFDLVTRVWTVPAGRMKGEREHRVPLSDAAMAVLAPLAGAAEPDWFIFPGAKAGRALSNMAMLKLLQERMGRRDCTVHGFRSSFRDWAAECTSFPAEVAEMALAHVVDDKTEAAYLRSDLFQKRRQLSDAWSKFCTTLPSDGVVAIPQAAAAE